MMPLLWTIAPNWAAPVVQRLEWLTSVMRATDETEQRLELRDGARQTLRYEALIGSNAERQAFERLLVLGQSLLYQLPDWLRGMHMTLPVSEGDTLLSVNTTANKRLSSGGTVVLIQGSRIGTALVESVGPTSVILADSPGFWPAGTRVFPTGLAQLSAQLPVNYLSDSVATVELQWRWDDEWLVEPLAETEHYRGHPVYLGRTDWADGLAADFARNLAVVDSETGRVSVRPLSDVSRYDRSHRWVLHGGAEIAEFHAWLAARRGRMHPFWLPSQQHDFDLQNTIGPSDSSFIVAHAGHRDMFERIGYRDIAIIARSGAAYCGRIVDVVAIDAGTELVTLSEPLGVSLAPSDIVTISYMRLARLGSDAVEIAYDTDAIATAAARMVGLRDADNE